MSFLERTPPRLRAPQSRNAVRLHFEELEDRHLLAVDLGIDLAANPQAVRPGDLFDLSVAVNLISGTLSRGPTASISFPPGITLPPGAFIAGNWGCVSGGPFVDCNALGPFSGTSEFSLNPFVSNDLQPGNVNLGATVFPLPGDDEQDFDNNFANLNLTVVPDADAPEFSLQFNPNSIGLNGASHAVYSIDNRDEPEEATDLAFTHTLPAGSISLTTAATTSCAGGVVMTDVNSNTISLSNGEVGGSTTCEVSVSVIGTAPGVHQTSTSDLTSSRGNSGSATSSLTVSPPPQLDIAFTPNQIFEGETSQLGFSIDNSEGILPANEIQFELLLPFGVAAVGDASTDCTGATLTIADSSMLLQFENGSLAPGASCGGHVSVIDLLTGGGEIEFTTSTLTSSLGSSNGTTATLTVLEPVEWAVFAPPSIGVGNPALIRYDLQNNSGAVTPELEFAIDFPSGLEPANAETDCGGATIAVLDDEITVSGGSVPTGGCYIEFDVTSDTPGDYALDAHLNLSPESITTTLTVSPLPRFSIEFTPNVVGDGETSRLLFTIDHNNGTAPATELAFSDDLPDGLQIADTPNVQTTCQDAVFIALGNSDFIEFLRGEVAAGETCGASVDVIGTGYGVHENTAGDLTSSLGNSGSADGTVVVERRYEAGLSISPEEAPVGASFTVEWFFDNETGGPVMGFGVRTLLPPNVTVSVEPNSHTDCDQLTIQATAGSNLIDFVNGGLIAGESCTVQVDVKTDTPGDYELVSELTSSLGNGGNVVSEFTAFIGGGFDFGDLPDQNDIDSFPTTIANGGEGDGAHHVIVEGVYLGSREPDAELDGQPDGPRAEGDDLDGEDDEDGIGFLNPLIPGRKARLAVTASTNGVLNAWADWNGDYDFRDQDEHFVVNRQQPQGMNQFDVVVPSHASAKPVYLRFRFTLDEIPVTTPGFAGLWNNGEVEDYALASVGDLVWLDSDGDGVQDMDEPGVGGITVKLLGSNGSQVSDGDGNPITTTTLPDGRYEFIGLPPGTYKLEFVADFLTAPTAGQNAALDSDADPDSGQTAPFVLLAGDHLPFIDAGLLAADFGDLPDLGAGTGTGDYQTLRADDGPRHHISSLLYLGPSVPDFDLDGQPSETASGDDGDSMGDDEDGIEAFPTFVAGQPASINIFVNNLSGSEATIYGFVDWDNDGDFDLANERATTVAPTGTSSDVVLQFDVPATAALGVDLGARFRVSTDDDLGPTGVASDGEVEDYQVQVVGSPLIVESTVINGGEQQRSLLHSIDLRFNDATNLQALIDLGTITSAVEVVGTNGQEIALTRDHFRWNSLTNTLQIDLTVDGFDGSSDSLLADGLYELRLKAADILKADDLDQALSDTDGLLDGFYREAFHSLLADLNGDKRVTIHDVIAVRNFVRSANPAADLDGDGDADIDDLLLARRRIGREVT